MNRRKHHFIGLLVCLLWTLPVSLKSDDELIDRFYRETPPHWKAFVDQFSKVMGVTTTVVENATGPSYTGATISIKEESLFEVARRGDWFFRLSSRKGGEAAVPEAIRGRYMATNVEAFNGKYLFAVQGNDKWILDQLVENPDSQTISKMRGHDGQSLEFGMLEIGPGAPFLCLGDKSIFEATAATQIDGGLIQIQFQRTKTEKKEFVYNSKKWKLTFLPQQLVVTFNPNSSWLPVSNEVDFGGGNSASFRWHYSKLENGIFCPVRQEAVSVRTNATSTNVTERVFSTEPISKDRFFLSYYGMPEPRSTRKFNWFWLLIIAGAVAVLVGTGIMLKRSARSK